MHSEHGAVQRARHVGPSAKQIVLDLAEEFEPASDAMSWTIRLRSGVVFHNGKDLTAEDVIYTIRRILNPKSPLNGATALAPIDTTRLRPLDKLTVRVETKVPFATFQEQIADAFYFGIVPVGYDPNHPVGTGPFMFKSFTPGVQSVFVRNPHYYKAGLPYLDELTIIDSFADDEIRLQRRLEQRGRRLHRGAAHHRQRGHAGWAEAARRPTGTVESVRHAGRSISIQRCPCPTGVPTYGR